MTNGRDSKDGLGEPGIDGALIDWALGERLGGERPPDLRAAVRVKLAGGALRPRPPRLLQAALMLLGLTAVCGVAFWPKPTPGPTPIAAPALQEPQPVQVSSLADVAALPAGTRAVAAIGVGDAVIEALTRLRELEVLVVREPWNEAYGLGLKMTAPAQPAHITNASWQQFAKFMKLRRLELSGTVLVARVGTGDGAAVVTELEKLPLLASLTMRCLDASDDVVGRLPKLPHLRELDLSFNHGFTEAGVNAVVQCRGLRKLAMRGCHQLHAPWLAKLGTLPELEELDLGSIDGMNWRRGMAEPVDPEGQLLATQARGSSISLHAVVNDHALSGIAMSPRLRILDIGSGRWTGAGLAELGKCTTLRELNMFGGQERGSGFVADLPKDLERLEVCGPFTDEFCAAVREHLPKLRHLCVAACYMISDDGLADLCAMPSLRVLDMRQMRRLTVASATTIGKAVQLEEIDVRHVDWVTARHVLQWRRQLPKLRKLESNFTAQEIEQAGALPPPEKVYSKACIEALPADTRNIEGQNLDDACIPALLRLAALEGLSLGGIGRIRNTPVSISDAGLRELAKLPNLRVLELSGQVAVTGPGFDVLRDLPGLETLRIVGMLVTDRAFVAMAGLASLRTVHVVDCRGFTGSGLAWLARAPALREVSLRGCTEIQAEWLLPLISQRQLEWLDLTDINRKRLAVRKPPMRLPEPEPGTGVTDAVMEALAGATSVHTLKLGKAAISDAGLRHLQGLPKLRELNLDETAVTGDALQWLPAGLERLSLRECLQLRGAFGKVLAAASPRLLELDLSGCRDLDDILPSLSALASLRKLSLTSCNQGLTAKGLQSLRGLPSLRELDLSYCTEFTADAVRDLVALLSLETLSLRGWKFDTAEWDLNRTMPNLQSIQGDKFSEKLR